jgi:hypothetical protein
VADDPAARTWDRPAGAPDDAELHVLAETNTDPAIGTHEVPSLADAVFTWDYAKGRRPQLARLYEKAKVSMWNAETDLPWEIEVDQERLAEAAVGGGGSVIDWSGTPVAHWGRPEWLRFAIESDNWMLSQFLHGEQGALLCTAKIVETVPWADAKYYAATQVMDEARHVEVFTRYLDKLSGRYPVNRHLEALLDDILRDRRWDLTYLGMQIMVEGLALASFGLMAQVTSEPLLQQLLRYVMADEARHVAFGVLSLREAYAGMTGAELRERQEFAYEAAVRMRDRLLQQEVWERLGVPPEVVVPRILRSPERIEFQRLLFGKIVPNCRKLGLLDANDGWLRHRFEELGVMDFDHDEPGEPDERASEVEPSEPVVGPTPAQSSGPSRPGPVVRAQ